MRTIPTHNPPPLDLALPEAHRDKPVADEAMLRRLFEAHPIKGYLEHAEGMALYRCALAVGGMGGCLEIGSYCGKSTLYLAAACRRTGAGLFALDHHCGSSEHQPGEEWHDPECYNESAQRMDTLGHFNDNMALAGVDDIVSPVVATSAWSARYWRTPLALVFIDGEHSFEAAHFDCVHWSKHVVKGGLLAIHDIFEEEVPMNAPHQAMKALLDEGMFELIGGVETLAVLRRLH